MTTQPNILLLQTSQDPQRPQLRLTSQPRQLPPPLAVEIPVHGAVFTLDRLGKLFGMLHIDDSEEPLLFTHLHPECLLPRGTTFDSFLSVKFGAIIDINIWNHKASIMGALRMHPQVIKNTLVSHGSHQS